MCSNDAEIVRVQLDAEEVNIVISVKIRGCYQSVLIDNLDAREAGLPEAAVTKDRQTVNGNIIPRAVVIIPRAVVIISRAVVIISRAVVIIPEILANDLDYTIAIDICRGDREGRST